MKASDWHATVNAKANAWPVFWERVKILGPRECWEWQGSRSKLGYGIVPPSIRRAFDERSAHRVACSWHWSDDKRPYALHSCDNPPCCNPRHLRWGTAQENTNDKECALWMELARVARLRSEEVPGRFESRSLPGPFSKNPLRPDQARSGAKLTVETVLALRAEHDAGVSVKEIAIARGMNVSHVYQIVTRKAWRHVP